MLMFATFLAAEAMEMPVWTVNGVAGSTFSIYASEISRQNGSVSTWLREYDKTPEGMISQTMYRMGFDCRGNATLTATTSFTPEGAVRNSWDGFTVHVIRPNTVEAGAEAFLCRS